MSTKKSRNKARTREYSESELKLMQLEFQEFLSVIDSAIKECRRSRASLWSFGGPSEDTGRKKLRGFFSELRESVKMSMAGIPQNESASKSSDEEMIAAGEEELQKESTKKTPPKSKLMPKGLNKNG